MTWGQTQENCQRAESSLHACRDYPSQSVRNNPACTLDRFLQRAGAKFNEPRADLAECKTQGPFAWASKHRFTARSSLEFWTVVATLLRLENNTCGDPPQLSGVLWNAVPQVCLLTACVNQWKHTKHAPKQADILEYGVFFQSQRHVGLMTWFI